jgi:hypothetical protein
MMRQWIYDKLVGIPEIAALPEIAGDPPVLSGGSLVGRQEAEQFLIFRAGPSSALLRDNMRPVATDNFFTIWVYDVAGSYLRIDSLLSVIRDAFVGRVVEPGAIACEWLGDSQELADEDLDRIVRNTSYRLIGVT